MFRETGHSSEGYVKTQCGQIGGIATRSARHKCSLDDACNELILPPTDAPALLPRTHRDYHASSMKHDILEHFDAKVRRRCHLLELPPDIRNIVYSLVFHEPNGVNIDFEQDDALSVLDSFSALTRTCKTTWNECRDLPYWLNSFHFHVPVLQDLSRLRVLDSPPIVLPLSKEYAFLRRRIDIAPQKLTVESPQLRAKAQEFITLAMRLPHIDPVISRLQDLTIRTSLLSKLRLVCVHLGSQTNNTFVARFFTAWTHVLPQLLDIRKHADLRITFDLRVSRRLVVHYAFGMRDLPSTLEQLDQCVQLEELTLPEMSTINSVRTRICEDAFSVEHLPLAHSSRSRSLADTLWPQVDRNDALDRKVFQARNADVAAA